ncbi:MAG: hypothetical protein JXR48_03355 [Candidatus Delongbacteria bacterium]|nr:hypothetical protein [Candidatus Delongbacteria bacterium]MBN2833985.1 hypothetical protein [Candidatus Delongbacteria bacterium]
MKKLIILETDHNNFYPLTATRAVKDLFSGCMTFGERISRIFREFEIHYIYRDSVDFNNELKKITPDDYFIINSSVTTPGKIITLMSMMGTSKSAFYFNGDKFIYGFISKNDFDNIEDVLNFRSQFSQNTDAEAYNYLWEIVNDNGSVIEKDIKLLELEPIIENYKIENVTLVNKSQIFIGKNVNIRAGVIIDASNGSVFIDDDTEIMHNTVIIGPCYIGKKNKIKIGAKIYENCSFGDVCKIGGELEAAIFTGYSNKQHDGFLGHAYIGKWCNFGADTNNSDLKNNYRNVQVELHGKLIETNSQFAGLFMGDHTKTGINTMFDTGTVVGVGCNVYGEGFPKRNIPSFNWGGKAKLIKYPLERILDTSRVVMSRRGIELSEKEIVLLKKLYNGDSQC